MEHQYRHGAHDKHHSLKAHIKVTLSPHWGSEPESSDEDFVSFARREHGYGEKSWQKLFVGHCCVVDEAFARPFILYGGLSGQTSAE